MRIPNRIIGRTERLRPTQRKIFDEIFESAGGYVLDFSNATMAEWFDEILGIEIYDERFQQYGGSKAKTLRCFVDTEDGAVVAHALRELFAYRGAMPKALSRDPSREEFLGKWLEQFAMELASLAGPETEKALENFADDTSVPQLRASIIRELLDGHPQAAIDRLHTFFTKRLRHELSKRELPFDNKTALHSLFGAYCKELVDEESLTGLMRDSVRGQYKLVEAFNTARNKRSFAHDNPLLEPDDAKYMVHSVLTLLTYLNGLKIENKK